MRTPPASLPLLAALIALLMLAQSAAAAPPADHPNAGQKDVIIVLNASAPDTSTSQDIDHVATLKAHAQISQQDLSRYLDLLSTTEVQDKYWLTNAIHVKADPVAIAAIERHPAVEAVVPDVQLTTLDTASTAEASTPWGLDKIGAHDAWDRGVTGDGVTVAVVDTGVDYTHPDLDQNIWTNADEIPNNGVDDDGNGYVDDYRGYDFGDGDGDPMDRNSHGTHVAGTIAGYNEDGTGTQTGVAPDAQIMPLKVESSSGAIYLSDLIAATQYAVDNGADVVSMSLGTPSSASTYTEHYTFVEDATSAGVTVSIAAGNYGPDSGTISFPGSEKQALTVGATGFGDDVASFSSRGPVTASGETYTKPDVSAPGVNIESTYVNGGYVLKSGTSMATPHVSGVAALLLQADPTLTPADVKTTLRDTALDVDATGADNNAGWGRIRIAEALDAVASDTTTPPDVTDLTVTPTTGDGTVTLDATLEAHGTTLTGARYAVDTDAAYTDATPLPAADGSYDSATETISTTLDLRDLPDGTHTLYLRTQDSTGATSTAATATFTIDSTAPTIDSTTTRYPGDQTRAKPGDTVTIAVTSPDADAVTVDASPVSTQGTLTLTHGTTAWTTTVDVDTATTGTHHLDVAATDAAGNTATATIEIDDDAPTASIDAPTDGSTATGTVEITGTATDPTALDTWTLTADGSPIATGTGPVDGTLTDWTPADGTHTLTLAATGTAGHTATDTATVTITTDDTTGGPTVSSAAAAYPDGQTSAHDGQTITIDVSATGSSVTVDASAVSTQNTVALAESDGSWTGTVTPDRGATGTYDLPVTATDTAGNAETATLTVRVDNRGPYGSVSSPYSGSVSGTVTVSGSAFDLEETRVWTVTAETGSESVSVGSGTSSIDGPLGTWDTTALPDGDATLRLTVTDAAGNTHSSTRTLTVDNNG